MQALQLTAIGGARRFLASWAGIRLAMRPVTPARGRARAARSTRALYPILIVLAGCGWIMRQGTIAYIGVNSLFEPSHVTIEIHQSFLERYKNRVLIHTTFTVDKAMPAPLPTDLDGDLHFSGRAPQVGLPIVAEISNSRYQKAAIDLVHAAVGTGRPLSVSGVWRIWPEHAGKAQEEQGEALRAFGTDNPDHIFEVHPVTSIGDIQLLNSFTPVTGFDPGDAARTFGIFEKATCTITAGPETVSIVSETGLYNDVEFIMQLADVPQAVVSGGRFVIASALDLKGKPVVSRLRMVFTAGTPPELAVRGMKGGERLHVYGMPRIDLAEVARRVAGSKADPALLTRPLPYEIIIMGVYESGHTPS